jgi:hypothetical protein
MAPNDVWDLLYDFMCAFDVDAVEVDEHGNIRNIRDPLPNVVLEKRISLSANNLSPLLRLPYTDMRVVLKAILHDNVVQKTVSEVREFGGCRCINTTMFVVGSEG